MKLKHISLLILVAVGLITLYKCNPKTAPIPTTNINNNPTASGVGNLYNIPGNNGFDYKDVSRGFGKISIPSLYSSELSSIYGRCDVISEGYYVMAVIAGTINPNQAQANFIIYFKSKPSIAKKYYLTPEKANINDTTVHVLFTDIGKSQKTWVATKGKVDFTLSGSRLASLSNLTGENVANPTDTIQFSGSVSCD